VSDEKEQAGGGAARRRLRNASPSGGDGVGPADDAPRIHLPLFEGPLDLLLYLIKREKIDIHDIPSPHHAPVRGVPGPDAGAEPRRAASSW